MRTVRIVRNLFACVFFVAIIADSEREVDAWFGCPTQYSVCDQNNHIHYYQVCQWFGTPPFHHPWSCDEMEHTLAPSFCNNGTGHISGFGCNDLGMHEGYPYSEGEFTCDWTNSEPCT
jgi:hypothetical protein